MIVEISYLMEKGDRENQEDAIRIHSSVLQAEKATGKMLVESPEVLLIVCDGLGGHAFGEKASLWCADTSRIMLGSHDEKEAQGKLYQLQRMSEKELPPKSGTTIAFCLINTNKLITGNAGDSKVYAIKEESIFQLTHDHTMAQRLLDNGAITPQQAQNPMLKNSLTLGIGPLFSQEWKNPYQAFCQSLESLPHYLVLCSDGLSDNIREEEILEAVLIEELDAASTLFKLARERNPYSLDNTSILIARLK